MATKDRTSLKNDFANGKYATGEKFADLIDSMKVVQLPVVDPQALGTSLSFIDSISQDADGKITVTKKTLDLDNAHELNPFKGWYETGDTLPTDGFDGAYLYFKDTSELTGQTTIYRWNGTAYADTGTVVDTSNVQTFETGQPLNEVNIVNDLTTGGSGNVLSAEQGAFLLNKCIRKDTIQLTERAGYPRWSTAEWIPDYTHYTAVTYPGSYYLIQAQDNNLTQFCFLSTIPAKTNITSPMSLSQGSSKIEVSAGGAVLVKAPSDGNYLVAIGNAAGTNYAPYYVKRLVIEQEDSIEHLDDDMYIDISKYLSTLPIYSFGISFATHVWANNRENRMIVFPVGNIKSFVLTPTQREACMFFLSELPPANPTIGEAAPVIGSVNNNLDASAEEIEMFVPKGTRYVAINVGFDTAAPWLWYPNVQARIGKYYGVPRKEGDQWNNKQYFTVSVLETNLSKGQWTSASLQDSSVEKTVDVGFILPDTYKTYGTPTPVIAVMHGAEASVYPPSNFGSSWQGLIQNYLNNGFAVFDVNGYTTGAFNVDTNKGASPWGCPRSVEAMRRAFEYLTSNYNVEREMYIHGLSAGGCLAYSFTMNYPHLVRAVSMFEPSVPTNNLRENHQSSDVQKWYDLIAIDFGYTSWSAAVADNFKNFIGYSLPLSFVRVNDGVLEAIGNLILSEEAVHNLVGHFPRPIRIFQGSNQTGMTAISEVLNTNIIEALQNGGSNASLRLVPGASHGDFVNAAGTWSFLRDEELLFFKRF